MRQYPSVADQDGESDGDKTESNSKEEVDDFQGSDLKSFKVDDFQGSDLKSFKVDDFQGSGLKSSKVEDFQGRDLKTFKVEDLNDLNQLPFGGVQNNGASSQDGQVEDSNSNDENIINENWKSCDQAESVLEN